MIHARRAAWAALLCLAGMTLARAEPPTPSAEESFWKSLAEPSGLASTTTFRGEYMEYDSSASVVTLQDKASVEDSSASLRGDLIRLYTEEKRTEAEGNVLLALPSEAVAGSTISIRADLLTIFNEERRAVGSGHIQIHEGNQLLRGSRLDYNWVASTGTIHDAAGFEPPWRFSGKRLRQTGPRTYNIRGAVTTNCDLEKPHYFFRSTVAQMVRGHRVTGIGATWWVGGLPVLWTPFFNQYQDLPFAVQIRPGESKRDGLTFRNNFYYGFSRHAYVRVYGDYLHKTGVAYGGEIGYEAKNVVGTIYGLNVTDHNLDLQDPAAQPGAPRREINRFTGRLQHWQRITQRLTAQANVNLQSDQNFNNLFVQDHFERIVNEQIGLKSELALTHQLPWMTSRASAVRIDKVDTTVSRDLFTSNLVLPSVSFNTIPLKSTYVPVYVTLSGAYAYEMTKAKRTAPDEFAHNANLRVELSRDIPVTRRLTFKPSAAVQENWQNTIPKGDGRPPDRYTNRVSETMSFRARLSRRLDLDFGHTATIRSVTNKFVQNANAPDRGIEFHNLFYTFFARPSRKTQIRATSGYNLRVVDRDGVLRGTSPSDYEGAPAETLMGTIQQRMHSPDFELTLQPRPGLELFIRELYHLFPSLHNGVTQGRLTWQPPDSKTYVQTAASYNNRSPGQLLLSTTAGFNLSPGWRVETVLEYLVSGPGHLAYNTVAPTQRELRLIRRLHCWRLTMHVIDRPEVRQFFVGIQLLTDVAAEKKVTSMETQEQLYPWRQPWKE